MTEFNIILTHLNESQRYVLLVFININVQLYKNQLLLTHF